MQHDLYKHTMEKLEAILDRINTIGTPDEDKLQILGQSNFIDLMPFNTGYSIYSYNGINYQLIGEKIVLVTS